jgi:hypothetical protein
VLRSDHYARSVWRPRLQKREFGGDI